MTVGELLDRVSSRELAEWMAYDRMSPIGTDRADIQTGIIASTVANSTRNPKKRRKPWTVKDFIPKYGRQEESEPLSPEKSVALIAQLNAAFGGEDLRK